MSRMSESVKTSVRDYRGRDIGHEFHAGVSLHAHTRYSREVMADLPPYILRIPVVAACYQHELRAYLEREGHQLDFSKGWWHPPVSPRVVFDGEARQIEDRLDVVPLVSLTDHDNISAGLDLQLLFAHRRAPISFEWTVPYGRGFFHIGVHNLPLEAATEWFQRLEAFTARSSRETLGGLFAALNSRPDLLLVLNHPCWDLANVGRGEHASLLRRFLMEHAGQVHALELNGYRSWKENAAVQPIARAAALPLISGGDRHGCAPNALLNMTSSRSFAEFAAEVRDGVSHVIVMPEYRQPLPIRMLAAVADVLRQYRVHPDGHRHWTDRVSWEIDGSVQRLSAHWRNGAPLWIRGSVKALQVLTRPVVLRFLCAALQTADAIRVRSSWATWPTRRPGVAAAGLGDAN
jgi:hypothetical protein